jgi:hypothetical protein
VLDEENNADVRGEHELFAFAEGTKEVAASGLYLRGAEPTGMGKIYPRVNFCPGSAV